MNKREEIISGLKSFFSKKALNDKISMAFLYGSWAGGLPRWDSDIDIALVFIGKLTEDEIFKYLNETSLLLSKELCLEVNVIHLHSDFREPMLYYNAIVLGVLVFSREFNDYVDLINEAIFHMEDFNIFGREWQLEVASSNLKGLIHD